MTNQPSPVLTAEERKVIEGIDAVYLNELQWPGGPEDPEQIRAIMHIHDTLKGLLSRTADPDSVTLPREVVQEFANALYGAVRDIDEWVQLANRQRREMSMPDYNPLCPTDAAISASKRRTIRACKAIAAISDLLPEDPQAQGGDDE